LADRGLVKRYYNDLGQRFLEISDTAETAYFSENEAGALDVAEEPKDNPLTK
jgi:hypothetical protein